MTEYLGFDMLDGEFKVMGMAPYGDPKNMIYLAWPNLKMASWW